MIHYFRPTDQMLAGYKRKLNNWFQRAEYEVPNDFTWYYSESVGTFVWSEGKKVGFVFRGSQILRDKLLFLAIQDGAEKLN